MLPGVLGILLLAMGASLPGEWSGFAPAQTGTGAGTSGVRVEVVARGLEVPWALAFVPDGRLFVSERPGRIRVIANGQLLSESVATLPVALVEEAGLMGLVADPDFAHNGFLYVMYTYRGSGGELKTRVSRLTEHGNRAGNELVILEGIPAERFHIGGRLKFGPDGKLYVSTGDALASGLAQQLDSLAGKVLRVNPDGSVPPDNPFPESPVYSLGHRNVQGLAWHPVSRQLFITEHGPTGEFGACCHDELNLVVSGANYGWPAVFGAAGDPRFVDPILESGNETWAPAGATFYTGSRLPGWDGSLFFAALRGSHVHRIILKPPDFRLVEADEILYPGEFGRIREVVQGPDGLLYFATSNRDGRGAPGPEDDRVLRVAPITPTPTTVPPSGGGGSSPSVPVPAPPGAAPSSPETTGPGPKVTPARAVFTPEHGTTVRAGDYEISISTGAVATRGPVDLSVEPLTNPSVLPPEGTVRVGEAFSLKLSSEGELVKGPFSPPLRIGFPVSQDLAQVVGGQLGGLSLAFLDESSRQWRTVPTDCSERSCVAHIDHLTVFALNAVVPVPAGVEPPDGSTVFTLGPRLSWSVAGRITHFHLQVAPFGGDGPAIDLVISDAGQAASRSYQIQAPVLGQGPYVMLPGMSYTWRLRVSTLGDELTPESRGWSTWSILQSFRTNTPVSWGLSPAEPGPGGTASSLTPVLRWADLFSSHFYYEVQVSRDPGFGPNDFLYWELRHGGLTTPLNSYVVPKDFPLVPGASYYWRVRPRVQGDGEPVPWSDVWTFSTGEKP